MPPPIPWPPDRDAELRQRREIGETWDVIAAAMGISRQSAIERASKIGAHGRLYRAPGMAPPHPEQRQPLPAGHPDTWALIALPGYDCPIPWQGYHARKY